MKHQAARPQSEAPPDVLARLDPDLVRSITWLRNSVATSELPMELEGTCRELLIRSYHAEVATEPETSLHTLHDDLRRLRAIVERNQGRDRDVIMVGPAKRNTTKAEGQIASQLVTVT
jgi:hypothetical protein